MASDEPDRIEIELTSHAPGADGGPGRGRPGRRRGRRRPGRGSQHPVVDRDAVDGAAGTDAGPDGIEEGTEVGRSPLEWLASERGRTVVVAGAVGALALLVGWMLGRTGGDDTAAVTDEPPTTAEPDRRPEPAVVTDDLPETDLELDGPIVERRSPDATVVTLPAPTVPVDVSGPVEVAPALRGIDLVLVGVTRDGSIGELDLANGERRTRRVEGLMVDGGNERIYAGPDWIGVPSGSGLAIIRDDGTDELLVIGDPWSILYDPTTGRFWTDADRGSAARDVDEIDVNGEPTGRSITLPGQAWPITTDRGALIVQAAGQLYRAGPEGSVQLARGELVGISDDVVVVSTCDASLSCGLAAVDRADGEAQPVPPGPDDGEGSTPAIGAVSSFLPGTVGGVSPDGRWVVGVRFGERRLELGLLELATGTFVTLPEAELAPTSVWSPDGRYLIYPGTDRLRAFDTVERAGFGVTPADDATWIAVTARPSSVGADEAVEG